MSVAVSIELKHGVLFIAHEPDLALATTNQVVFHTVRCFKLGQLTPQFDDVSVSIFPVAEKFEVFNQFFDIHVLIQTSSSLAGTYVNYTNIAMQVRGSVAEKALRRGV
jgi:hypothetical protein